MEQCNLHAVYGRNEFCAGAAKGNTGYYLSLLPEQPNRFYDYKGRITEVVDYANKVGAVIIYDAAYEAYISEENVPHTIFECEGARTCAIELRSFSKNAGFTEQDLDLPLFQKI